MLNSILAVRIHAGFNAGVFLGGLLAIGEQTEALATTTLRKLFPQVEARISFESRRVNGISGFGAAVVTKPEGHVHRHVSDVLAFYEKSTLSEEAQKKARSVWSEIASAEARVHQMPLSDVHFHEVGRLSNILAVGLAAEYLIRMAPSRIAASPIPLGDGTVKCAHGLVPYPAPALFAMLEGVAVRPFAGTGEAVTPTGLGMLKGFGAEFGFWPEMRVAKTATVFADAFFGGVPNGTLFACGTPLPPPETK